MTSDAPRRAFAVTWDYRCPFARNAHEHVLAGLRGGVTWDVTFLAFSLGQVHVAEGEPDIWDRWQEDTGLLALQAGVAIRDHQPDRFLDAHDALFALRHDHGGHLRDEGEVRQALGAVAGVDVDAVFDAIASGQPLQTIRSEHEDAAAKHGVWGVPTFIADGEASFVRLMDRPGDDHALGTRTIERILDLLSWRELNEFKHPRIPR